MELPIDFIRQTQALLGEEWENFLKALEEDSPVSIRLNPKKSALSKLSYDLSEEKRIAWAQEGFYLDKRPVFTLDPLFHAGNYYVQEASSMFLGNIIRRLVTSPSRVLDLCAAPGGKSTDLLASLPEGSLLVANEIIRSRAKILSENLIKWGFSNCIVTNNDPAAFAPVKSYFDVIVADVPCSGEGMFRKDPNAISEWSTGNVGLCAERQRRIVADVWKSLLPGGLFVYSTCTYNKHENEDNINWICQELGAELIDKPHRFFPHQSKGEGFFIAALRKSGDPKETRQSQKTNSKPAKSPDILRSWLRPDRDFSIFLHHNEWAALPSDYFPDYLSLQKHLNILHAGVLLGEQKGKDIIPAHALALSVELNPASFPHWEVDLQTALRYLRRESFNDIPPSLAKGFILVSYQGVPLGFIKNIGSRANNLYPVSWRILIKS